MLNTMHVSVAGRGCKTQRYLVAIYSIVYDKRILRNFPTVPILNLAVFVACRGWRTQYCRGIFKDNPIKIKQKLEELFQRMAERFQKRFFDYFLHTYAKLTKKFNQYLYAHVNFN